MKGPIQQLNEVFEQRDMTIMGFYMHFLLERNNYLKKELDCIENRELKTFCNYKIYADEHAIEYNGKKITIPNKEFLIAKYLSENKNRIVHREELLLKVWGNEVIVLDRTIDVHMAKIRKRFTGIPIVTKKTVGYMWEEKY